MIFNSITFILFLLLVISLYWILPSRNSRLWLIFIASITFYGFWRWEYVGILLLSTVIDYWVSLKIDSTKKEKKLRRVLYLLISLIVNLGLLIYFKYTFFIVDNINNIFNLLNLKNTLQVEQIILPLGVSFYTFQTISYTIDVYRGHTKAEKDFVLYACYVTFFPQLVAGPILRAEEVMSQLIKKPVFRLSEFSDGIKRIIYGFFLKVVLADNIAGLVDEGFNIPVNSLGSLDVIVLAFLFGFQIYFDFAGYSHIAIGCAKLMGIEFPENFNFPYAAKSFKSFWKRWHISLSSWIRDYLYLPLTGKKVIDPSKKSTGGITPSISNTKKNWALFLTWAIMGLWHGANWTYVLWGIYHSILIFLERILKPVRQKIRIFQLPVISWSITITFAMLGWIPFRAQNVNDVIIMFQKLISPESFFIRSVRENSYLIAFVLFISFIAVYLLNNLKVDKNSKYEVFLSMFNIFKYAIMIYLIFIFFRPINQFIYFQF